MPAMQPVELWKETGREQTMGETLIHLPDQDWRSGTVLGPTHEEVITDIVRTFVSSYKHLPINLYQIQTKFRDEKRPKSGVLRTREFLMKDAYSFDVDLEGLNASYDKMYAAYCRIYERCGLPYVSVEADSGAIGGDVSHEFMVATDAGEDTLVKTVDGSYAANVERAEVATLPDPGCDGQQPVEEVHTPGLKTIDEVSRFLHFKPSDMIKTLIYEAEYYDLAKESQADMRAAEQVRSGRLSAAAGGSFSEIIAVLIRGDHDANEAKLTKVLGATTLKLADEHEIRNATGAEKGFSGPVGLETRIIADHAVAVMHNAVTGANKTDYHITGVNPGRDFELKEVADIRYAVEGDRAPNGQALEFEKCIEVGHVFKLGTKYSDAMKATFLDQDGKSRPCVMGCYGIGINRIMAAAIETHHDDAGIIWPMPVAPFHVLICCLDIKNDEVSRTCRQIHDTLESHGVEVLLDDREVRAGPKFKDADLIGIPIRITVGQRSLKDGLVEVKNRDSDDVQKLLPDKAIEEVRCRVRDALAQLHCEQI
ncbi:MAG: proline--tRNA ligase, partial [Planctomycetes bacterium]|nr:proline--tRNA ligase [Planctomycetota bacterium]